MIVAAPNARARRRRRWSVAFAVTVVVVIVVGGFGSVLYRSHFHAWPGQTYPATLHVCDRDFEQQGEQQRRGITANGFHLVRLGRTPGFIGTSPLWTYDTIDGKRVPKLDGGCGLVMWIQGSGDRYRSYALEGGP